MLSRPDDIAEDREWGALLVAAQRGDARAYRDFLRAILPFARALARHKCFAEEAIEDVVQEALLTVHRVRATYEPGRAVKPWLATIVTRRAIDANRRRGQIERRELSDPEAYETFADPAANKDNAADSAAEVAAIVAGLTPKQKEAVELVKLRELSLAEASAASGQSVGSLKVNVHRALKQLRIRWRTGASE